MSHLHEGIMLGLKGQLEKNSTVLGRSAVWNVQRRISRLPKFMCVQMMRFFWKAVADDGMDHGGATGVPCKILKSVAFPVNNFDVLPYCGVPLAKSLAARRDITRKAEDARLRAGGTYGGGAAAPAPVTADMDDGDLAAAVRASLVEANSGAVGGGAAGGGATGDGAVAAASGSDDSAFYGPGVSSSFQGMYNLAGLVSRATGSSGALPTCALTPPLFLLSSPRLTPPRPTGRPQGSQLDVRALHRLRAT